jgi:hypothetical protein
MRSRRIRMTGAIDASAQQLRETLGVDLLLTGSIDFSTPKIPKSVCRCGSRLRSTTPDLDEQCCRQRRRLCRLVRHRPDHIRAHSRRTRCG